MATNETTNTSNSKTSNTESSCKPVSKTSSDSSRVHCSDKARPAKTTESSR